MADKKKAEFFTQPKFCLVYLISIIDSSHISGAS